MGQPTPVPLIAQHESWISLDPVQGCPAACAYCYLHPLGLTRLKPETLTSPAQVYDALLAHPAWPSVQWRAAHPETALPICIGNYTDMALTPPNRAYLLELLAEHARRCPQVPVCIVTKAVLSFEFLRQINALGVKVIFFISLAFLPHAYEPGTPRWEDRLENFSRIAEHEHLRAVHFWRPITALSLPDPAAAARQLQMVRDAGAMVSVITGLAFGEKLTALFSNDAANLMHDYFTTHYATSRITPNIIFEADLQQAILDAARAVNYPIYFHSSCAVSLVLGGREYNGTFRQRLAPTKCWPTTCPSAQRARCGAFAQQMPAPAETDLATIAHALHLDPTAVQYDSASALIQVAAPLEQAQQTFFTHATSFPVRGQSVVPTLEWVGTTNTQ